MIARRDESVQDTSERLTLHDLGEISRSLDIVSGHCSVVRNDGDLEEVPGITSRDFQYRTIYAKYSERFSTLD
jgi:hypothetical protein